MSVRLSTAVEQFRESEIEHFHMPINRNLDVRRLQISMDDALLVRRLERFRDLPGDRQRLLD